MESLLAQLFNPNSEVLGTIADTFDAIDSSLQTIGTALYDYNSMLSALKANVETLTNYGIAITVIASLSLVVNAFLIYKVIKIDHKIDELKK